MRPEKQMLTRLLMTVVLLACGESVRSQTLGEVAARENERRARTGGPTKSFTDSDLRDAARKRAREGGPSTGAPLPASDPSPAPPLAPDSSGSTEGSPTDASRKARGAEYKFRLDATDASLAHAEEKLRFAEKEWDLVTSHPMELAGARDKVRSRLEDAQKNVRILRSQREEIEDAARREGIPPGYLR
jgi:hypothetical protein